MNVLRFWYFKLCKVNIYLLFKKDLQLQDNDTNASKPSAVRNRTENEDVVNNGITTSVETVVPNGITSLSLWKRFKM